MVSYMFYEQMNKLKSLLDSTKIVGEKNGILFTNIALKNELEISKRSWERIYDFEAKDLEQDRADFFKNKLDDHFRIISQFKKFSKDEVCLEIGCGPAYIGEYLMKNFDLNFIGVDFNLKILDSLKQYFDKHGLKKYLLIYADINDMPLRDNVIDFIYGGGVIEHSTDTLKILKELNRVLKEGGVSFNTVPAFNLSWLPLRFYNNIPSTPILRSIFEFIHVRIFKNKILGKNFGYELSFTQHNLKRIHKLAGFKKMGVEAMTFHPSPKKLKNQYLRNTYYFFSKLHFISPVYYISAYK